MAEIETKQSQMGLMPWDTELAETGRITPHRIASSGWLARDGRFFPCDWFQHARLAAALADQEWPENDARNVWAAERWLEERGWWRIDVAGYVASFYGEKWFSEEQMCFIREMAAGPLGQYQSNMFQLLTQLEDNISG